MKYFTKNLLAVFLVLTLTVGLTACANETASVSDPTVDPVSETTREPESDPELETTREPESDPELETTWEPAPDPDSGNDELENPWINCRDDMAEAVEKAGFDFYIMPLSNFTVAVIPDEMIQVTFPRDEFDSIVLRKSPYEPEEGDISGDNNEYPETGVITVDGVDVRVRRDGDTIYVAAFTAVDGTYCVSCTAGMTEAEVTQTLTELMEVNAK